MGIDYSFYVFDKKEVNNLMSKQTKEVLGELRGPKGKRVLIGDAWFELHKSKDLSKSITLVDISEIKHIKLFGQKLIINKKLKSKIIDEFLNTPLWQVFIFKNKTLNRQFWECRHRTFLDAYLSRFFRDLSKINSVVLHLESSDSRSCAAIEINNMAFSIIKSPDNNPISFFEKLGFKIPAGVKEEIPKGESYPGCVILDEKQTKELIRKVKNIKFSSKDLNNPLFKKEKEENSYYNFFLNRFIMELEYFRTMHTNAYLLIERG